MRDLSGGDGCVMTHRGGFLRGGVKNKKRPAGNFNMVELRGGASVTPRSLLVTYWSGCLSSCCLSLAFAGLGGRLCMAGAVKLQYGYMRSIDSFEIS